MPRSRRLTFVLVAGVTMRPTPVWAHVGTHGDAGILSNVIAVAIVTLSIVVYLLIDGRKRRRTAAEVRGARSAVALGDRTGVNEILIEHERTDSSLELRQVAEPMLGQGDEASDLG